jgi:hypothetical protein
VEREATVCAAVLIVGFGYPPKQAMSILQKTRSGTLQNPFQQLYLEVTFVNEWKKFKSTK